MEKEQRRGKEKRVEVTRKMIAREKNNRSCVCKLETLRKEGKERKAAK